MIFPSTLLAQDNSKEEINKVATNLLNKVNKSGQFAQQLDSTQMLTVANGGYQMRPTDGYAALNVPMGSSAQTVRLPPLSQSEGRTISVYTTLTGSAQSSYGALTIKASGNDLIDGIASLTLSSPWLRCVLFALKNAWVIVEYEESGSNAGGSWVKWADGTMECYAEKVYSSVSFTLVSSPLYRSGEKSWSYPVPFVSVPSVPLPMAYDQGGSYQIWTSGSSSHDTSSAAAYCQFWASSNPTLTLTVRWTAIGKWK